MALSHPPNNTPISGILPQPWQRYFSDLFSIARTIGRSGAANLVGGTVIVSCPSVTTASLVFISRAALSGTPGHLSYVKTPGVGFTVNSTSATDTSAINWFVVEP